MTQRRELEGQPWPFRLQPGRDELLSGYLCRVAKAHGSTPYAFMQAYKLQSSFWARDVDRLVNTENLNILGHRSGLGVAELSRLSLTPWMRALGRADITPQAIVGWINAVGVFHRNRYRHGLAFCSVCLDVSGFLDRHWRLSFQVACSEHACLLLDACPYCDQPLMPHRCRGEIWRCEFCLRDLRMPKVPQAKSDVRSMQASLLEHLNLATAGDRYAFEELSAHRQLTSALVAAERRQGTKVYPHNTRIETSRHVTREHLLRSLARLLEDWPFSFRRLAKVGHLAYADFDSTPALPEWLRVEIDRLPRRFESRNRSTRPSMIDTITDLERKRPDNWRALRAALLMRSSKISR